MTALTEVAQETAMRTRAPLTRFLRSELRMVLRRPRTIIFIVGLALVPVAAGIGFAIAGNGADDGPPGMTISSVLDGNGLMLPIFGLVVSLNMLLPLSGAMWAADAVAGESSTGTLRGLLLAPVGRARLLAVKAFGVATVTTIAVTVMTVTGAITGVLLLGGDGLLTMSGSTLGVADALGRVLLTAALVTVHVWAVAAIALAVSAFTDHPLVVLAVALGTIVVFTVLGAIQALDWLHPYLITTAWQSVLDVVRDPLPMDGIATGLLQAGCYIVIGYSIALARVLTKDG